MNEENQEQYIIDSPDDGKEASFDIQQEATLCSTSASPCNDTTGRKRQLRSNATCNSGENQGHVGLVIPPSNAWYFGYTLNICPDKVMNGRKYKGYNLTDQQRLLNRITAAGITYVNNIGHYLVLSDVSLEICPQLGQHHIHMLLLSTYEALRLFDEYLITRCHSGIGWRTTYTEKCFNRQGWKDYIHKEDYKKNNY